MGHQHLGYGVFQKISIQFRHTFESGEEPPETAALAERLAAQYACVEYRPCAGCRE